MLLKFQSKYASIDQFHSTEITNFTVLTGVNGSGKSHLLEAIEKRNVIIEGLENAHIVLFDYESFRLDNEPSFTGHQLSAERESAWQFYEQHIKNNAVNWRNQIGEQHTNITEKAKTEKRSFWAAGSEFLSNYKNQFRNFVKSDNFKDNMQAQGVFELAKKLPFSVDEISHDEFVKRYKPYAFKKDFLPAQIGKIFWDYYVKFRSNQVNQYENSVNKKNYPALSEVDFIALHGEKPWELANKVLKAFDALTYEFRSPEGDDFFGVYQLRLIHTEIPDLEVDFEKLSSGERILLALVASIYKASSDNNFPDLLLLDEIDASLHPSMIKNMLNVIEDIFLPRGTKIILVTHSPTTIALSPEDSIFIMNRTGENRIEKKSQKEALSILTQGYATIEEGIKFFDEVAKTKLTIITEGNNTSYITKMLELYDVCDVEVLQGIEGASGKNQLRTLFDFFSRMDHKNDVLFVFDCDVSYRLQDSGNTYSFKFSCNKENDIATTGIENLFSSKLFEGFITTVSKPDGSELKTFHSPSKGGFEKFVIERNNKQDFKNFELLLQFVKKLRNESEIV